MLSHAYLQYIKIQINMKGKISNPNFMKKPAATQAAHVSTGNKMLDAALTRAKNSGNLTISDK